MTTLYTVIRKCRGRSQIVCVDEYAVAKAIARKRRNSERVKGVTYKIEPADTADKYRRNHKHRSH